jgi:hypothetical protein
MVMEVVIFLSTGSCDLLSTVGMFVSSCGNVCFGFAPFPVEMFVFPAVCKTRGVYLSDRALLSVTQEACAFHSCL